MVVHRNGIGRLSSSPFRDLPLAELRLDGDVTVLPWSPLGERLGIGTVNGEVIIASISIGDLR